MDDGSSTVAQPKKQEFFSKVTVDSTEDPHRLDLVRVPNSQGIPEGMSAFWQDVQRVSRMVNALYEDEPSRRIRFYEELHVVADTGLRGPDFSLEVGQISLDEIKDEISNDFPAVRDSFWTRYFKYLSLMLLTCGPLGGGVYYAAVNDHWPRVLGKPLVASDAEEVFGVVVAGLIALCWIPLGAALGIFVEFVFRVGDGNVSFDQLQSINPGRWKPFQRFVNTVVVGYLFAALMGIGAFQIGIAHVLLNDFSSTKPYLSVGIGFVTGLAFSYVRDVIYQIRPEVRDGQRKEKVA
jgi:hypothetical protein